MSNPKIKYAKERNGNIFYPRTTAEAIRFEDGESLETKFKNGGLGGDAKNFPIATELEAREASSNDVLMTPLRTLQLLEENGVGAGGGGGGITIPIITSEFNKTSVDTGTEISIPFTFYSPNLGKGTLHCLVDGVEVMSKQIPQGSSYADFGVLPKGSHRLSIFVVDRGGIYTDTLSYNIRIGALDITSTFDDSTDFTITQVIKIPVTIDTISVDPIYMTYTIDSTSTRISAKSGYNVIQLPVLTPGAHKVTIKAESGVYVSNILAFNVVIEDASNLTLISDFDTKEITYRKLVEFIYRVSLKGAKQFIAKYYDNGELLKTLTIPAGTNIWSTRELPVGEHELKIVVTTEDGVMSAELIREIKVIESDYKPMLPVTDASLVAWFDATGKTNNDIDKEEWIDKSPSLVHPTAELHNINYGSNGWIDNALKLNGGAYAVINLQPLKEITNAGLTVDIRYKTRDVGFQEACVLDMRGSDTNNKGFAIDTEKLYLNSATKKISSDVIQEEISRATFVIDKENGIAKIFNNGVLTETFLMTANEDFYNNSKIYLGTTLGLVDGLWQPNLFGDCEIYSIRVYERALESEEIVQNLISDIVDLVEQQEKYELNYMNNMPTMYFYGDISAMTKDFKVPLRIKYISTDPNRYGESFDLADCQVSWQGTSSLQYAVKNYKIRLKNQDGSKYKYSPYPDGIKEDTFCLKADYMESSHANNTGMAKFINDQLYETPTPPQANDPSVRTTINGFPIQLYIALNDSVEPTYIGIFNFNHDKSCNKSLGLDNEVEGFEECVRFEVSSNSDTSAGAFRDDSDESMRADFEINYPDEDDLTSDQKDAYYTKLKRVISWVKNSTAETFKAELEQYFNKEYLIKYFVQAHLFGMVDNLGKNMMIATWDGNIWYPMFYDMDTQLGLDNTGYMEFVSDIDMVEGVYNTSNSKLFVMLKECFADEIADTYCTLRRKGNYSMPTILSYWYGEQVSKIGELQYNKDMEAKYIAFKNDYLFMLHGRRYEHMKKWLAERMLYLDTIYGFEADTSASITIRANTLSAINLDITTYSPQYLKVKWRNGIEQILKIGRDANGRMTPTRFSGTVATATDQEIIVYNARQIKNIGGLASANPSVLNLVEASRLIKLECSGAKLLNDVKLSDNNKFLSYVDLNGCVKLGDTTTGGTDSLDLSKVANLEYVNLENTILSSIEFPKNGSNLITCYLPKTVRSVHLENMPRLQYVYGVGSGETNWECSSGGGELLYKTLTTKSSIIIKNCPLLRVKSVGHISAEYIHLENTFNNPDEEKITDFWCINPTYSYPGKAGYEYWANVNYLYLRNLSCFSDCSVLISTSGKEALQEPTNTFDIINCDIKDLTINKLGFAEIKEELDLSSNRILSFAINGCSNVKNINLPDTLTNGLALVNSTDFRWTNYYHNIVNLTMAVFTPFEDALVGTTFTLGGESLVKNHVLDLSSLNIKEFLWLEDTIVNNLSDEITTISLNCNFSEGTGLARQLDGYRLKLPITMNLEGYLKSVETARIWGTTTTTLYPPIRDFDKFEWDLSEVQNFENMFRYWKNLTILPDSLTPEVVSNGTNHCCMFEGCSSLININKLEGADLEFNFNSYYKTPQGMFREVQGPFTLGNLKFTCTSSATSTNVDIKNTFYRSGVESVGNITVDYPNAPTNFNGITFSEFFKECPNLKSVGTLKTSGYSYVRNMNYFMNSCKKLESFGGLDLVYHPSVTFVGTFRETPINDEMLSKINIPNNAELSNCFYKCAITDITKLNNYYDVIRTSSKLPNCFCGNPLTTVPDLLIESTNGGGADYIFSECINLVSVGSIEIPNITGQCFDLFNGCTKLETVEKLSIPKATTASGIFRSCKSLREVKHLDLSSATALNLFFHFYETQIYTPVRVIFKGILKTKPLSIENVTFDLETWQSFVQCAEQKSSAYTCKVGASNFALFTEEMLATMSAKNWTITA